MGERVPYAASKACAVERRCDGITEGGVEDRCKVGVGGEDTADDGTDVHDITDGGGGTGMVTGELVMAKAWGRETNGVWSGGKEREDRR